MSRRDPERIYEARGAGVFARLTQRERVNELDAEHSISRRGREAEARGLPPMDKIFILQVAGPTSVRVMERVLGKSLRDLEFLQIRKVQVPGIPAEVEVEASRIAMVGTLAYELRGPFDSGPAVYDAVYQAGKDLGIRRLGWRTYTVNHTEGGFPQLGCTFTGSFAADEGYANSPFMADFWINYSGSLDPTDLRARMRTPGEVNWLWMAKFDHDFLGREAVEAEAANRKRKTVILRWNPEDIADIQASMFQPGEHYMFIEFPTAPQAPAGGHADLVTKDGRPVGISSHGVYSYYAPYTAASTKSSGSPYAANAVGAKA